MLDYFHFTNKLTGEHDLAQSCEGTIPAQADAPGVARGRYPLSGTRYLNITASRLCLQAGHASEGTSPTRAAAPPGLGHSATTGARANRGHGLPASPPCRPVVLAPPPGPPVPPQGAWLSLLRDGERDRAWGRPGASAASSPEIGESHGEAPVRGGGAVASSGRCRSTYRRPAADSAPGHRLPSRGVGVPRAAVAGRLAGPSFRGLRF